MNPAQILALINQAVENVILHSNAYINHPDTKHMTKDALEFESVVKNAHVRFYKTASRPQEKERLD